MSTCVKEQNAVSNPAAIEDSLVAQDVSLELGIRCFCVEGEVHISLPLSEEDDLWSSIMKGLSPSCDEAFAVLLFEVNGPLSRDSQCDGVNFAVLTPEVETNVLQDNTQHLLDTKAENSLELWGPLNQFKQLL